MRQNVSCLPEALQMQAAMCEIYRGFLTETYVECENPLAWKSRYQIMFCLVGQWLMASFYVTSGVHHHGYG